MKSPIIDSYAIKRLGLIAGEGRLPVHVARNATRLGVDVVPYMLSGNNVRELRELCGHKGHKIVPGLVRRTYDLLMQEGVSHIVFAGKVNKWVLLKDPRIDEMALEALKKAVQVNDDAVMLWLVDALEERNIQVVPQTDYLQELFIPQKQLTRKSPSEKDLRDIRYGFQVAKEMGRLDIGQTIVTSNGMVLAVEAIEGTDECLKRAGKLSHKKGGVVVKVAKPNQDQRFDVPAVGLRTLKKMRRYGLKTLATEADETLYLEPDAMIEYADKHDMIIVSTDGNV